MACNSTPSPGRPCYSFSTNNMRSVLLAASLVMAAAAVDAETRLNLSPAMVVNESGYGNPEAMVDEQGESGTPPAGKPQSGWAVPWEKWKAHPTADAYIDLGTEKPLGSLWLYDSNGAGELVIAAGLPGKWTEVLTYDCRNYNTWQKLTLNVQTRYLRFTRKDGGSNFAEISVYAYPPEEWQVVQQQKVAEQEAKAQREAAIAKATRELAQRPLIDLGEPFGKAYLVDEMLTAVNDPGHLFQQDPATASRVETILGKPCRVLNKTPGEAACMTFRLGQYKLLKPGAAYVLEIEYPEDQPRSMVILNGGNETARGFHTGAALGDAYRPRYVNNENESIQVPLTGQYQTWTMYFNLHDRFPNKRYLRGAGERPLLSADGFTVTIAQFSAENLPISHGAAVSRIRLFELPDPAKLNLTLRLPPGDLPRRHLFWREEMADGVISGHKEAERGLKNPLDWYRYKANLMEFLGMRTFTKDLLEFGAVQHWDTSPGGGNHWAYFDAQNKDLWGQIVELMGARGMEILPYYEYAGSKGQQGLGPQRRAKPLTRDDAYTHIQWIEDANADITDPDTYADFQKMLDHTVLRFKDKARFAGIWLRPRSQLPIGFGDATRRRFAQEANGGKDVTRQQLKEDKGLLAQYEAWWFGKRRQFLAAMRDYLRTQGVADATVLFTTCAAEAGAGFGTFKAYMPTDNMAMWRRILAESTIEKDKAITPVSIQDIVADDLYLKGLLSPPPNWGGWEVHHANPASDPGRYKQTEGVLLTHAINRLYTVASPKTFEAFRGPSGLAVVRHYALNEDMMFARDDQPKLGYFVADIERAGPHCMMAEAMAMANGDPRFIGYLVGLNYGRGFPKYVREFNRAFLALPALPSTRLDKASSDAQVVVRAIPTKEHGTYLAIVNAGMTDKPDVEITLPSNAKITDAATGQLLESRDGKLRLSFYPWQLRALKQ
ncbi:MAG TPA: discoidin domain-containing protein [Clostridia bacterium]|nr:discoidin domain-containing protein [Clostridia bacterium]